VSQVQVRRWLRWLQCFGMVAVLANIPHNVLAQQTSVADALASEARPTKELLARPVTVGIDSMPLREALETIAGTAGVRLFYRTALLSGYHKSVTFHATRVSMGVAFERILTGTSLRVVPVRDGSLTLVESGTDRSADRLAGEITGVVRDAETRQPIRGAFVVLDDSVQRVRTGADGRYRFVNISNGMHRITVRYIGFSRQTRVITVTDSALATTDFALVSAVNTLDQVVVTATGAQRYRELGHVVSQINADSLVQAAPITSLSELLTARVPGLQVLTGNGGTVGGAVSLRLRGQTTTSLDPQPVVIVDGVRYRSDNLADNGTGLMIQQSRNFNAEPRSPLNDLNVNDIETINVVKGPSASTLYGPDAANGVIVITTKRGKAGKTEWHVYTAPNMTSEPATDATSASGYRAWGHDPATGQTVTFNCTLEYQANPNPQCVLDSITVVPTAGNASSFGVLAKHRPQWHSGASVGGGTQALSYFLSGNYDSEIGAIQLSPFAASVLRAQLGTHTLDDAIRNPNTQQSSGVHASVSAQATPTTTLGLVASYTQATQRAINLQNLFSQTYGLGASLYGDTSTAGLILQGMPVNAFLQSTQLQSHRLTASGTAAMRPRSWLAMDAAVGTDLSSSIDRGIEPVDAEGPGFSGVAGDDRSEATGRTANAGLTMTGQSGLFSLRSSLGAQYIYTNVDAASTQGSGLAPGSTSISTATTVSTSQSWTESAELGVYGEEVLGLNERLFLTGSLRLDGSTTFGDAYHARPYPKVGLSWIVSDEPAYHRLPVSWVSDLRVRSSYGAASRYPDSRMKNGLVSAQSVTINGQTQNVFVRTLLANPLISPEKTREFEYGMDMTLLSTVNVGITGYTRRINDQLNSLKVPTGFLSQWANVGDVSAHGVEITLGARVFTTRPASLDLDGSYSYTTNKLLSLGAATGRTSLYGSIVVGSPLGASFGQTVASVTDVNGDSVITFDPSEYTLSPVHYLGTFFAPRTYTLSPTLSLFDTRVRVSALFDRQSGGIQYNSFLAGCGNAGRCVAQYLKTTPLLEQANLLGLTPGASIVSSDFTRWRELAITTDLPSPVLRHTPLSHGSISAQVRNIALWTKFKGPDPESVPGLGFAGVSNAASAGAAGIPQAKAWALRVDLFL